MLTRLESKRMRAVGFLAVLALAGLLAAPTHAQQPPSAGSLDTSFGGDGVVTTAIGSGIDEGWATAVQPDGKIVVTGASHNGANYDFALARYNADGTLDTGFGTPVSYNNDGDVTARSGKVTTPIGSWDDVGLAVALQPDGKIVVAGDRRTPYEGWKLDVADFALARYTSDGDLDTTFGNGGKVTTNFGNWTDTAYAVAVYFVDSDSDSIYDAGEKIKIVAAGRNQGGFPMARYDADGTLDTTFGTVVSRDEEGKATARSGKVNFRGDGRADAVAVYRDADGELKIVAAGSAGGTVAVLRLDEHGDLDTEFGPKGYCSITYSSDGGCVKYRYHPPGFGNAIAWAKGVAVQSDGKIVVAGGFDRFAGNGGTDDLGPGSGFVLARMNPDGTLDPSFDDDGLLTTDFGYANGVALQVDGKIVAVGGFGGRGFALARYNTDGSLDTGFGSGGKVITSIGSQDNRATAVALQSDGKIVAAGFADIDGSRDFAVARYHSTGSCPNCATDGDVAVARTYSVNPRVSATEGENATVTLTLVEAAPSGGVEFKVKAVYGTTATSDDVGAITTPVTVPEDGDTLEISIPIADDDLDEGDETFTVTVTANTPGWLAEVGDDTATVTIKDNDTESQQQQQVNHAPAVASPLADLDGLPVGHTRQVSLSGVFSYDGAGALTIVASSSDTDVAGVTASTDGSSLTVTGKATGTATIAVVAQDPDGDRATDEFSVTVTGLQEPWNLQVVPGDGAITVTWEASPFYYKERLIGSERIKHALRWWQGSNWANPVGEKAFGRNDGIHVENGVTSYVIQNLTNDVAVEVQVRAFFGSNHREGAMNKGASSTSSKWVKAKAVTPQKPNQAPTVASAIDGVTIVNESGSSEVSLSGVFADADLDDLTVTASSSSESVATVSVSADYSTLTITAKARGSANVTVTASDGRGGSVEDSFTVTVKAAPVVASAIADVSELAVDATHKVSLSGVFSDADGDSLTVTANSSKDAVATVSVAADYSGLTLTGKAAGTATITATAQDSDGNSVSDSFDVTVVKPNSAPTVASAISDATIVNESGTKQVSLSGVFTDADSDSLTVTASSSDEKVATVSVSADYSGLTVTAKKRGTATITVTAKDGNGGSVEDSFTVKVKAAPAVASAIADIGSLVAGTSQEVALTRVFSDADNDTLTLSASSSATAVATVSVATDGSKLTVAGVTEGTATITVTAQHSDGNSVSDTFDVTVLAANKAPTVASAISDATIVNTSGTKRVSLSGVFTDADGDSLTITAKPSAAAVATVSVAADYSTLTVTAKSRGTATITVTASDGKGGSVEDSFTVTVKAAPAVASAIADVSELAVDATHKVSLSGVFTDADADSLTVTASSSKDAVATVSVAADQSGLTLTGKAAGTATITVTARDADGNSVSDAFDVAVVKVNSAPTVASAIDDATIVNESGTKQVSLSGVFTDADGDSLTIKAKSSSESVATVSVSADYSSLTETAKARGATTITVTASDGKGGSVEDSFTVTVKAAPVVASAIADISELATGASQQISLSSVFSDADGDALTLSAVSSSNAVATVSGAIDPSTGSATAITVTGVSSGTATVTVTARDTDGNSVSDAFDVTVPAVELLQVVELPGPVVSLAVTASAEDSVTVSWSAPDTGGAPKGYIVHIKRKGGGYQDTLRPGADRTQVSFSSLDSGRTYEVWVRAQNETGKGERVSASITLPESEDTPPAVLPGPVTGLELTADGNALTVSWSAPETGGAPDGYIVHVSPDDGGKGKTKTPKAMKTQVTFKNLEAGRTYAVWVRAQNEAGKGERVHASITLPQAASPADQGDGK